MGKWSPAAKARHSKRMAQIHARRRARKAQTRGQGTMVFDHIPAIQRNINQLGAEYNKAVQRGDARGPLLTAEELHIAQDERFPLAQYRSAREEMAGIVEARDRAGRNSYLSFWEGFPHGLADITFEAHRRVARVLGVERQLANGFAQDAVELKKVMRSDLLDLANYALFGVMKLDKDAAAGE